MHSLVADAGGDGSDRLDVGDAQGAVEMAVAEAEFGIRGIDILDAPGAAVASLAAMAQGR
ncbi:MAG: hypothetical protein AAGC86_12915 [Pseudomonadota bacterium]